MGQNVIELNGKRYDAITGAYLGKSSVIPKHITDRYVHGKVIDGFVRPAHPAARHKPAPQTEPARQEARPAAPQPTPSPTGPKPKTSVAAKHERTPAKHVKAHAPEHAQTLMHRHVKKPQFSMKPAIKVQAPAEIMAKPASALQKRSAYSIHPLRQERAALINQHQAVRHFHPQHKTSGHSVSHVPVLQVRPAPLTLAAPAPRPAQRHTDIFEAAIAHANSHEQPAHKHRRHHSRRRKLVNAMAIVATFLIIGGFIGYLNLPQLELKMASFHAGFGASMPAYTPTGYALDEGVERNGGTITLNFRSGENRFSITQQSSNWNSQTLLDNTLALGGKHQTIQKNGQTVYVYDNGTRAAWVNGGVRYDLSGNTQLSDDEIVAIATSM